MHSRAPSPTPRPIPRPPRAFTLIELIIALSITACVTAVLAILMNSTAVGTNSSQDGRRSLVKMQGIKAQIEDTIANARCVLDSGPNYLVLWMGDQSGAPTPTNGAVNLSELRLLEVDTATGNLNLWSVQWPNNFNNNKIISDDTTYAASTTWYPACTAAQSGGYFTPTLVATHATGLTVSLDSASTTQAHLVSLVLTFTDAGPDPRTVVIGARIPSPATPW